MRHVRVLGVLAAAVTLAATAVLAQTTPAVTPVKETAAAQPVSLDTNAVTELGQTHWGDAKAGQAKAVACAACHGPDGNPADPQYPRIAGMPERYVALQLALFKSGERVDGMSAVMMPFASALSAQDMRDVGAYFALQQGQSGVADDTLISSGANKGQPFYMVGQTLYAAATAAAAFPPAWLATARMAPATQAQRIRVWPASNRPIWCAACRTTAPATRRWTTRCTRSWPRLPSR